MQNARTRCNSTNSKGARCKLFSIEGTEYCRYHQPEQLKKREQKLVKKFIEKNKKSILAFLENASDDPLAREIYNLVNERLGLEYLGPPVREEISKQIGGHFQNHKDAFSLYKILPHLKLWIPLSYYGSILGDPWKSPTRQKIIYNTIEDYIETQLELDGTVQKELLYSFSFRVSYSYHMTEVDELGRLIRKPLGRRFR